MRLVLKIALLLLVSRSSAQQFHFRRIGTSQGLPSSECYYVMQDSRGYMWFSTNAGLCKYNGSSFQYFSVSNGMPDNTIFEVFEDRKGRLWFNTVSGTIGYIKNDSITIVPANVALKKHLMNGQILIYGLTDEKNDIVISADRFYKLSEKSGFSDATPIEPPCDTCLFYVKDAKNGLYLIASNWKALPDFQRSKSSFNVEWKGRIYHCPMGPILNMAPDKCVMPLDNGDLLLSINNYLMLLNGQTAKHIEFPQRIIYMYSQPDGGLWIGLVKKGLYYYEDHDLTKEPVISLDGLSVSSVVRDYEGGIWASTLENGIYYSASTTVRDFLSIKGLDEKISSVSSYRNKVIIGNYEPAIFRLANGNAQKLPGFPIKLDSLSNPSHLGLTDAGDRVLLAGNPVLVTDTALSKFDPVFLKGRGISANLYNVSIGANGETFGINHSNIYRIRGQRQELAELLPARGRRVKASSKGLVYVGTVSGIYLYEKGMFSMPEWAAVLKNVKISFIEEDPTGNIWIGTEGKGLLIHDGKENRTIREQEGLASGICYALAFDEEGNAWLGTNKGISLIRTNGAISNFNTSDGLISNENFKLAICNSILYSGTPLGLCAVDITDELTNLTPPLVHIKKVLMNDSALLENGSGSFSHNQNNFHFTVDGLSYKSREGPRFLYRLLPIDTSWTASLVNEISYTTLPPGSYRFEVKALNNSGTPSSEPAVYSFTILKPFWLKWWFFLIVGLFAMLIVYTFIRSRLGSIQKREEEKTKVNTMIAEYQMTALRAQMNPHFIFNAINSIQNFILDKNTQEAYDYLAKFSKLIRLVLNNAQDQVLTLEKELEMLSLYVELEQLRFRNSFDFKLELNDDNDLPLQHIPAMLIQPFIENAIWHGIMPMEGSKKGKLLLAIKQEGTLLKITIEDNGIGRERSRQIKKSPEHKSLGMMLTGKRLELLNNQPESERASIHIVDMTNEKNEAAGTRVEIVVPLSD